MSELERSGQVLKPCPYRKEHEWEPESISTPRYLCKHCYTYMPEVEIPVPAESLPPDGTYRGVFWGPWQPPVNLDALQKQMDAALAALARQKGLP